MSIKSFLEDYFPKGEILNEGINIIIKTPDGFNINVGKKVQGKVLNKDIILALKSLDLYHKPDDIKLDIPIEW
jgi:hypothetical protein